MYARDNIEKQLFLEKKKTGLEILLVKLALTFIH